MRWALLVGIAPVVLAFIAGFFRMDVGLGWGFYIGWFVLCIIGGTVVTVARK